MLQQQIGRKQDLTCALSPNFCSVVSFCCWNIMQVEDYRDSVFPRLYVSKCTATSRTEGNNMNIYLIRCGTTMIMSNTTVVGLWIDFSNLRNHWTCVEILMYIWHVIQDSVFKWPVPASKLLVSFARIEPCDLWFEVVHTTSRATCPILLNTWKKRCKTASLQ